MLNLRLRMLKLLKQEHKLQTTNFFELNQRFDKVDNVATEQK